jgi:hypothetical protein
LKQQQQQRHECINGELVIKMVSQGRPCSSVAS